IGITELVPVQVDALVGEEVRRGPEDPLLVVIGQDLDQGAVHVEGDRSDVHALRQHPSLGRASAPSVGGQAWCGWRRQVRRGYPGRILAGTCAASRPAPASSRPGIWAF